MAYNLLVIFLVRAQTAQAMRGERIMAYTEVIVVDFAGGTSDPMTRDEATDCASEWDFMGYGPCILRAVERPTADMGSDLRNHSSCGDGAE